MAVFKMGTKTVLSQTGSDNPTWGANAPTGTMLQTVHAFATTATIISSTDMATGTYTTLTATITPSSASNKILISGYLTCRLTAGSNGDVGMGMRMTKTVGGTESNIYSSNDTTGSSPSDATSFVYLAVGDGNSTIHIMRHPFSTLVTAGTEGTYQVKLYLAKYNGTGTINVNNSNMHSQIMLQEIAG